ncbi:MAG: hypothetical protein ACREBU_00835 [Nitrososphaera sp.]
MKSTSQQVDMLKAGLKDLVEPESIGSMEPQKSHEFLVDQEEGLDQLTADLAYPRLKIIQTGSQQILESNPDLSPGNIYNTFTEEQYPGVPGITCSLIAHRKMYIEAIPMRDGGGIVAFHDPQTLNIKDFQFSRERSGFIKDGNDLFESHYHFVRVWQPVEIDAILIFARTQIVKSNIWRTLVRLLTYQDNPVSVYGGKYNISVVREKRKSFTYFGWRVQRHPDLYVTEREFKIASNIYRSFKPQALLATNNKNENQDPSF